MIPYEIHMSHIMRKRDYCLCQNKGADQLAKLISAFHEKTRLLLMPKQRRRSACEADQHLCFRCKDSAIPLLPKCEISSFKPPSVTAQTGLCPTWSEHKLLIFLHTGSYMFYSVWQISSFFEFFFIEKSLWRQKHCWLADCV